MSKASDNPYPSVLVVEGSAPSSPASGDQRVFIDVADHKLKRKNSSGTVTTIEGGGGSSTFAADTDVSLSGLANLDQIQYQTGDSKFHNVPGGMVRLAQLTPTSGAATFSGISGAYSDLFLSWDGRCDAAVSENTVALTLNGDTGSNYDFQGAKASGTTQTDTENFAQASVFAGWIPGTSASAGLSGGCKIELPNYAGTTFNKRVYCYPSAKVGTATGNLQEGMYAGFWRSAAAITSVTLTLSGGNFVTGSVVTLWGLV